jgi:hypothetical protein
MEAVALLPDLKQLPAGDLTEIGEGGVSEGSPSRQPRSSDRLQTDNLSLSACSVVLRST